MHYSEETRDIKEYLCDNIKEVRDDVKQKGVTDSNIRRAKDIFETVKDILKVDMLMSDEYGDYSRDGGDWEARGSYDGGSSYARDGRRSGMHYVRGHYSRADGMDDEYSMARGRDSRGRYSRDGYSRADGKQEMIEQLDDMIESAGSEREREALRKAKEKIQNA